MDSDNRRREMRATASVPAQIVRVNSTQDVEIVNASYRGLFIRCVGAPPSMNQLVRIRIVLPGKTVDIHAIPVRVVVDAQGRQGVGLRFFALNGEDKRFWDSFVSGLLMPQKMGRVA